MPDIDDIWRHDPSFWNYKANQDERAHQRTIHTMQSMFGREMKPVTPVDNLHAPPKSLFKVIDSTETVTVNPKKRGVFASIWSGLKRKR